MALLDGVQISKVVTLVEADSFAFAFNFVLTASLLIWLTASLILLGYCCYMLWKEGWSFSNVMFAKEHDVLDAAFTRLEETLASTHKQLAMGLDNLNRKMKERNEMSRLIANKVDEMKSEISRLDDNLESINKQTIHGLVEKAERLESKQVVKYIILTKFPSPASRVSNYMKQGGT